MDYLEKHIEALIYCAQEPISIADIRKCLADMFEAEFEEELISNKVSLLQEKFASDHYVFHIVGIAGGYQFLTKPAYQESIAALLKQKNKKRLSTASLETLSIIAYRQPITKANVEAIRGVNSDYAIQKLLERELIEFKGKAEAVGRPVLYGTSMKFMEHFGINSLTDLPHLKDVELGNDFQNFLPSPEFLQPE